MSKKKPASSWMSQETKKSVAAVLLIAFGLVLFLARWSKAGPAGEMIYSFLEGLFGVGYYFVPLMAIGVAIVLFFEHEKKLLSLTLAGAILSLLAGLGLVDILFPGKSGFVGDLAGILEHPFGFVAALILNGALFMISLLVTFNASIRPSWFLRIVSFFGKSKKEKSSTTPLSHEDSSLVFSEEDDDEKEQADDDEGDEEEGEEDEDLVVTEGVSSAPKGKLAPILSTLGAVYNAPPLSLLKSTVDKPMSGDLRANANIIKRTLESFGVLVEMGEINIGPKVTRYTLKPAQGMKLSKILSLNQDLALALAAHPIRIEAPIPGKSLVGIEVPNKSAAIVRLGSLMGYAEFTKGTPLSIALGRDVSGEPLFADLEKMPHMLVAGATGSGKSVTIHSLILSLLYKNSPDMLKLIMIDPKRVELSIYEGIPHLISSVVTQAKKSVGVFRWAIQEMDRRYEILLEAGVRDITSYNSKRKKEPMPFIVIVVDELADLMTTYGREIESSIVRLAQMARATGIHLVLSTQRPSVEVITGLIKANITARVALQVPSQIDSRTILDTAGAEKLLGGGDMLFVSSDYSKPKRIQGAYISEAEINDVAEYIREHNELAPSLASAIDGELGEENGEKADLFELQTNDDEKDELYEEAIGVIREAQRASASLLQRRLKIGYARAARILDIMESEGLIGPGEGAKPRDVLI